MKLSDLMYDYIGGGLSRPPAVGDIYAQQVHLQQQMARDMYNHPLNLSLIDALVAHAIVNEAKKSFRQELRDEVDEWLKDVFR